MLKYIVSKIKTLLNKKSKPAAKQPEKPVVERKIIPVPPIKSRPVKSVTDTHQTEPRKKETPEEYRARHQQRRLNNQKTVRPQQVIPETNWNESEFKVPVVEGKQRFHDLGIRKEILHAVFDLKFEYCTQVQAETLEKSLKGEDVSAQAQTGTGKTAAFLITIFDYLLKNQDDKKRRNGTPKALILAPTRELVMQIEKDARLIGKYVPCSILSVFGGMDYRKQQAILQSEPCDILICTPGRLIDYLDKNMVDLSKISILVIDEADRMLNMGFIPEVRKIVNSTPSKSKRQTLFFTATMTSEVSRLAESWTRQAFQISLAPDEMEVQNIEQITYITTTDEKMTLLYNIITKRNLERVLIFANRRDEAKKLKETLERMGITCSFLSGDVDQRQRISRLENFRSGKCRVLVATDIASRGIHVEAISHVINYNMPQDIEEYIHRIGRTGRAGASGISINFADEIDSYELGRLEEYLEKKIECVFPEEELLTPIPESATPVVSDPDDDTKPARSGNNPKYKSNKKFPPRNSGRNQGGRSHSGRNHSGRKPNPPGNNS